MLVLVYSLFLFYLETLYKLFTDASISSSFINSTFYLITIGGFLALITEAFPKKISKHIFRTLTFVVSFWIGANIIVYRTFGITLSFSATGMVDQFTGGGFIKLAFEVILDNWYIVVLCLIPTAISIIYTIFYPYKKTHIKNLVVYLLISLLSFGIFISSLFIYDPDDTGIKDLYFTKRNNNQNVERFGVLPSLLIDIRKELTGFKEEIIVVPEEEEETPIEPTVVYEKQISNIDFAHLAQIDTDENYLELDNYFAKENVTYTNQYTGLYEGKNLIYIMAESFDGFMVSEELTPTLYKMIHSGFEFNNYYSTTNLSTIGGEFQELTGLIPDLQCLSWKWRATDGSGNYYPYGLGTLFKNMGYSTYAYHNHDYTFQERYAYLKGLGFDNFLGCGNGIEKKGVGCAIFPESDDEMILGTYKDFINDEHFMVYYATVSGHMGWGFVSNDMAIKHKDEVEGLDYSETVRAYIAANLELELAMTDLLKVLEENGRLDDTVIVLAADHHPYGLSNDQVSELAGKELDKTFELYRNNLIIYNPSTEYTPINKPCGTVDVLPTTLNLFGIDYDSRLMAGKDILAKGDGLVIFADGSWISDKGRYNNKNNNFETDIQGLAIESYVERTNRVATNRIIISKEIMYYDYYRHIFGK